MKKILIYIFLIIFIVSAFSFWSIVSKGYDRQNKIILILKKIISPHLARKIKNTIFYIPNLKEKNRSLNLQVKKYEQGLEGQLFKESESLSEKGKKYYVKEFFLPFPRLDTRLGWAAKENSKRAHYLEIVKDKVLVISGLGQTIYFDKENITSTKLNQKEIKNNIKELLKEKNYELYGIRDLFFEDNYIYISMLHKDKKKGITINLYRAEINFNKLNFETYFETNEYWPIHNVFTGGRIETFKDDKILFSIGFSKKYKAPQDKNSFLGKIIAIDKKTKNFELISFGHRNPQGLFFSNKNNLIINTEHGPYGGDEVNFNFLENNSIEKNFGWPISSKGKPYPGEEFLFEENNWLIKSHKENGFISPIKSYSPAIGISEIVYLEEGKKKILYVSSLRAGSIYIINLDEKLKKILNEDRLFFNEQRIRDLEFDSETNSFFVLFEYTPSVAIIKKLN
ncbi:PQQ-dependent sugar dehydrogenase [Pelagibacteraceae bacterium]|jgi:glucose/arabinose dehydrogenase|nr:PQQ-dependent sugar dehydrogenase [Pelagibacteraceae bacterium]